MSPSPSPSDLPGRELAGRARRAGRRTGFALAARAARHSGWLARRCRWPLSRWSPSRRAELHLVRGGQLGDVLMCTPAIRRLKEMNPRCRVTFHTEMASLVEGLPFIDAVRPTSEAPPDSVWLTYEESIPPRRHIARIFGDHIGVDVRDIRPSCVVDHDLVGEYRQILDGLPRPWIIVNRRASAWTPNKEWPDPYWDELVGRLLEWAAVIEIGTTPPAGGAIESDRYVSFVGKLTLDRLVALIAAADLNVGPISGPVHVAAAVAVPSVVIYGGYERPVCTHYPGNIDLYSTPPCSPCWMREPCPFEKKCLGAIVPDVVERSIERLWSGGAGQGGLRREGQSVRIH